MQNKSNIYIYLVVFIAILLGISLLVNRFEARAGFRTMDEIVSTGKLRAVFESGSLGVQIEKDSISGFQYELLRIFADSLGVELVVSVHNDLHKSIQRLKRGRYDIIAKLVPVTTEWIDDVLFTEPLFVSRQMLIQQISENEDFSYASLSQLITQQYQLAHETIYIPRNSPHRMRLMHLADEIAGTIHLLEMKNQNAEQMISLVSEGKIRNTIAHEQLARSAARNFSNIDASLPLSMPQALSWVVNKQSDELLEKLNTFLSEFIGTNEYWQLYRKYY